MRSPRSLLGVPLLLTILSGCSSTEGAKPEAYAIPNPPAFMNPVKPKLFKPGTDPNEIAATRWSELSTANERLVMSRKWVFRVQRAAGGGKSNK